MKFFALEEKGKVLWLSFNRPEKYNSMNQVFWDELPMLLEKIEQDGNIKVVIWRGNGKGFSSGLDLLDFFGRYQSIIFGTDEQNQQSLYTLVRKMQACFEKIAMSSKVHIAAIHGGCIGGGLDFVTACDIRFASQDAFFSIRETQVAIVADLGSLNRLPFIIGQGNTRLMAFTGSDYTAQQALQMGLVSEVFPSTQELFEFTEQIASQIAENSSITLQGVKCVLNYQMHASPQEGLEFVAQWNSQNLNNKDFREMIAAKMENRKPRFS